MSISLENIEQYTIPFKNFISNWIFTDENDEPASIEHQDQISILTKEAANFLWNYEIKLAISSSEKYFKNVSKFNSEFSNQKSIKKYLFNLGIPFNQKVYIAHQPDTAFILTWKMVIKYSHRLFFAHDQIVSDRTLNWMLEFHHDGEFTFGKDLIYDSQLETLKNQQKLESALKEMRERSNSSNQH